jgi:hypothetical protein
MLKFKNVHIYCNQANTFIILQSCGILPYIFDTLERTTYNVPYAVDVFRTLQHKRRKY